VTYECEEDAHQAIDQYDGANAHGQPIRLSIISTSSSAASAASNPNAGRSLFERVERPRSLSPVDRDRERVRPSGRGSKIDRYVPDDRDRGVRVRERGRRDRPIVDRGDGGRDRRRDGGGDRRRGDRGRRGGGGGGAGGADGKTSSGRRPRKTIEELDEEMSNYWNETVGEAEGEVEGEQQNGVAADTGAAPVMDDDMMIE